MDRRQELDQVIRLARAAGTLVLGHHGNIDRLVKRGEEAVTRADRDSQRLIIAGLDSLFPGDAVIGEENDHGDGPTRTHVRHHGPERCWVIDPIDGTNNFIAGFDAFAVCIGLLEAGRPVLGVVLQPAGDICYGAAQGLGAWVGARRVRACPGPLSARSLIMMTSNLLDADRRIPGFLAHWLRDSPWKIRMMGSAALEAVQVAAGVAHGAITINGKLWDLAAAAAVLAESGAVVTDLHGRDVFPYATADYDGGRVPFLAAGPEAHGELLADIRSYWDPSPGSGPGAAATP